MRIDYHLGVRSAAVFRLSMAALVLGLSACAPTSVLPGPATLDPVLRADSATMADGARLPLHVWRPDGPVRAVIVALHGFNDYGTFIKEAADHWRTNGIATYAYDQRGFGDAPHRGMWPGGQALIDDLGAMVDLVARDHPDTPVFALGDSMGGAVVISAMAEPDPPRVRGVILVAPAVWGYSVMPFYQRWPLWIAAHTVPWLTVSGRGLGIMPSDNIEMLRALGRDPKVIKDTRIDTIWGLTHLMDRALDRSAEFASPALILYGVHDEIIPSGPTRTMLARLPEVPDGQRVIRRYDWAYHMVLRDLGAERAWQDVARWIDDQAAPLYPRRALK